MECSEKLTWKTDTRDELEQIQIEPPDEQVRKAVQRNWDAIAKPLDGMGRFEKLIAQIGAVTRTEKVALSKKTVLMFCADNGIVEEGISQSGQEVTTAVAMSMGKKQSSVCRMAKAAGADTIPVDIGINGEDEIPGVLNRKIRKGTRNFRKEPAMTEQETIRGIAVGIELVRQCRQQGYDILATGEMGIGNTTTSSAVTAALLREPAERVTGRGAGLNDAGLLRKQCIITEAIQKYDLAHADALTILETVGGLDLAGLTGMCIGGALYHVPIVLDGIISMAAALTAERLVPGTKAYLLPSHKGKEPAAALLAEALDMEPVIAGGLALGEGTGAVMMFSLLDLAMSIYEANTTFSDIQVEQYTRF